VDILRHALTALFCSVQCPGKLILQTYDYVRTLRDNRQAIISGFHSPMEQECLKLLLRGGQPIVICPARSIERLRVPPEWKSALEQGRLLVLSPFEPTERRATEHLARERNAFVAALADEVLVAYAAPGSKTLAFAGEVLCWGKPVRTFGAAENAALLQLGAIPVTERATSA
jgi:predicted Rossmann fold nucleotide-binding protein DprA/Smf involved in DNA uptake